MSGWLVFLAAWVAVGIGMTRFIYPPSKRHLRPDAELDTPEHQPSTKQQEHA